MSELRRNVIANFVGQGWRAIMALAFVPIYIRYIGIESYGLIGMFAILQTSLGLLDMGIKPALAREMASYSGGGCDEQSIWNLLRSSETVSFASAFLIAAAIWLASGWIASDWVQTKSLSNDVVANAFGLMGVVASLQFVESIYSSSLAGLQRQVAQNVITSSIATMRGLGAIAILAWVSPTAIAFFAWQAVCSAIGLCVSAIVVYRSLPAPPRRPQFRVERIRSVWRFAAGMLAITALALLLTQVDKILLSRMLTLEMFGYYALAGTVAGALTLVVMPITAAYYPRFNQFVVMKDEASLRVAYHQSAQLVSAMVGSVAAVLIFFAHPILLLWTGNPVLTQQVAPVLSVLTLGTLLNCLMWVPYQMQLAHGWTSLAIGINIIAVCVLVPALFVVVPIYGQLGAAWIWVALNTCYVIFGVQLMHRRILSADKWSWYLKDVGAPITAACAVAFLASSVATLQIGKTSSVLVVVLVSALSLSASGLATPSSRLLVLDLAKRWRSA